MEFRDLKRQYQSLRPKLDAAMQTVCGKAAFIAGSEVGRLEETLAAYVGKRYCVTCANGTDALSLAMMAWGVGPGDAVFVPDFTFFASGETVATAGAEPVFVDVCEDTFNMDPERLEEAIERVVLEGRLTPRAVMPVDLFGLPADYAKLRGICDTYGLKLLEDGAQGFGGSLDGAKALSFGDIAAASFFPAKPLGCYGDGGALFTDDSGEAALLRSLAVHGKGSHKYDNIRLGRNSRLDTLQAAILLVKLEAFQCSELEAVQQAAARYGELLAGLPLLLPVVPEGHESSWAQYTVRLENPADRGPLMKHLKNQGIPTMVYYPRPLHLQPAFEGTPAAQTDCPVTEALCESVLSLPMHPYLEEAELVRVAEGVRSYFKR